MLVRRREREKPLEKRRRRWEDNIRMDLKISSEGVD